MKASKSVFVIGAGASSEIGLPSGRKFIDVISEKLNFQLHGRSLAPHLGDQDIMDVIQSGYAPDMQALRSYIDAAQRIRSGLTFARSIDSFIDVHRNDPKIQLLGKLASVKTILEQEKSSALYRGLPEKDFQRLPDLNESWFVNLARGLNDGVRREEIDRIFEKVSFIVFNYDRCVEYFLHTMLQQHYGIDAAAARSVMATSAILHPYGKIADLPWQGSKGIPFGFPANRANLIMMSSNIKTYTEQIEDEGALEAIKSEIAGAETIVFMGFSYLDLNLDLIDPGRECAAQYIFGTAFGVSESDLERIKEQLRKIVKRDLRLAVTKGGAISVGPERLYVRRDLKCAKILDEYSRDLFAAGQRSGR
jgi:hypothetical protein